MIGRIARAIPARFAFDPAQCRPDGWGRLALVHPAGVRLLTQFRLRRGDGVLVDFRLPTGEEFAAARARVRDAALDPDGYTAAELSFEDPAFRIRLGKVLASHHSR